MGSIPITTLTGSSAGVIRVKNVCENNNPLVVGGTDAPIGEFPHMVALGRRPNSEFILMCGGTLISHTWVLSAAHCTYGPEYTSVISFHFKLLKISNEKIISSVFHLLAIIL